MIHQPSGGAQGQATDIEIQAREILQLRARLNEIYVKHTGQPLEVIADRGRARQLPVAASRPRSSASSTKWSSSRPGREDERARA